MTHHRYISFIAVAGLLSFVAWLLVIFRLSPYELEGLSLSLFFITFFMFSSSLYSVLGYYFRVWLFKNEIFYKQVNVSLRQGVILGLLTVFVLVFQKLLILNWFSGLLLIIFASAFEFYFSMKDSEVL